MTAGVPDATDIARLRGYVADELQAAATYRALAEQVDGHARDTLLRLADEEEQHARRWADVLDRAGTAVDTAPRRPGLRARALATLVGRVGIGAAIPFLERQEDAETAAYTDDPHTPHGLLDDEADHAASLAMLAPNWRTRASGSIRAAVFGVSDGVVSNAALVAGMVGANSANQIVVTAGVAGLLAGACSMAAGEYVSVASQQELLAADGESEEVVAAVGSPLGAAVTSFATFTFGAVVPLLPFLFGSGFGALLVAAVLSLALLGGIGATLALFTDRPLWLAASRQMGLGLVAALVTYGIGSLVGVVLD